MISMKTIYRIMKTIKLFTIAVLAALMGGSLVCSCANDNDDFLNKNDKELSDLRKEDAAIRAELKKQIELMSTEISLKINTLETMFKKTIDDEGQSIYDQLIKKIADTKVLANEKFDDFDKTVKAKLPGLQQALDEADAGLYKVLEAKQKALDEAIKQQDVENKALIEVEIAKISPLIPKMTQTQERMKGFEARVKHLEEVNSALVEIEQSVEQSEEKYVDLAAEIASINRQINQTLEESFKELSTRDLELYNRTLADIQPLVEEMSENLEEFNEVAGRFNQILEIYTTALFELDPDNFADDIESLEDKFNDVQQAISDINNAPSVDDFDISTIDNALEDLTEFTGDFSGLIDESIVTEFEELLKTLEDEEYECSSLNERIRELISEYEDLKSSMFD